ncbi:18565_t:CDS:2 [Funneliformis geosporum]|uniref:18565_t:CDS:1 n=1 Tax=Funneliformis geosporum TaxID=1117311 RepID=A0A9W4T0Y6_9GLOM|nr:18565_t:CDS:2 [Funneliformis geosporum]
MTKACYQLFQKNKNPSDMDIEQAFKQQVQTNYSQKMQELANLDGWNNFWNAGYSISLEYFQNLGSSCVHKLKDTTCIFLNLFSDKLSQFASSKELRSWKESERVKQARNNFKNKVDNNNSNSSYIIEAIL